MNIKLIAVVALLASAGLYFAQAQSTERSAATDPRLDKLIEQNEKILKNQAEMSKTLDTLRQELLQLRRRSS